VLVCSNPFELNVWINVRIISYTLNMKLYLYTCIPVLLLWYSVTLHHYTSIVHHTYLLVVIHLLNVVHYYISSLRMLHVTDINLEWVMKMN